MLIKDTWNTTRYIYKKKVIIDVSFKDEIFIGDYPSIPTILLMSYFIISSFDIESFFFFFLNKKHLFQNQKYFHVKFILLFFFFYERNKTFSQEYFIYLRKFIFTIRKIRMIKIRTRFRFIITF